jgi:hypothetical protein
MHYGEEKDVFISYRREDGATAARLLCDALERRNISTFFDKETIEGDFHKSIKNNLAAARNVLVVVSARMFSRCLLEDGSYDEVAVKGDWVYEELRISLESDKKIIPVFVNGVTGFPAILPDKISRISKIDALILDHQNFDSNLNKLIGRFRTTKHILLDSYIETDKEIYAEGHLESLLRVCTNLSPSKIADVEAILLKLIRSNWQLSDLSDSEAVDALFDGVSIDFLKNLCKRLELDNTGGVRRMKTNLLSWVKNDTGVRKFKEDESENDRSNNPPAEPGAFIM